LRLVKKSSHPLKAHGRITSRLGGCKPRLELRGELGQS
jgi:hypothetical protein